MTVSQPRIGCIGAGYVGGTTMAVAADRCPDLSFKVVDIDPGRIAAWNSDHLPVYEPGLDEIVARSRKNLVFSTEVEQCIEESDILFVSVNTPTKVYGAGSGRAADLSYWEKCARLIARTAKSDKIVVTKSTVPVGTSAELKLILQESPHGARFEVVSNPEFLAEGQAVENLLHPNRVLIGHDTTPTGQQAGESVAEIYARWVPRERLILTNLWSSELSKLASNAMLAQRISSINSLSALCERTGADILEVQRAVGADDRIGSRYLRSGPGFGGSCLRKDVLNLVFLCRHFGLLEVADYWESIITINEYQQSRLVARMMREMFHTLADRRIAVFGAAFKENTGDTRESPSLAVCRHLLVERAKLIITDPKALDNARQELPTDMGIEFVRDPYEAVQDAHAIILLTNWEEYRTLDYAQVWNRMVQPAYVFDTLNVLDQEMLRAIGFHAFSTGRRSRAS